MEQWMKVAVILAAAAEFWLLIRFIRRLRNLPPGPFRIPIIGNFHNLGRSPQRSLAELSKVHGPLMSLQLGKVTMVVVSSAAVAQLVLQKHDRLLSNKMVPDSLHSRDHHRFSMVFLPADARWRKLRKICNSLVFSNKSLEASWHLREKKRDDLISYIRQCSHRGSAVNIGLAVFSIDLGLLSSTFFSMDLGDLESAFCLDFQQTVTEAVVVTGIPNVADFFPALKFLDPQGIRRRMDRINGKLIDFFRKLIDERLANKGSCSAACGDALDALLETCLEGDELFDMEQLTHVLMDLFIAGTETTSVAIEWAMAELLREPSKLKRAQAELERVVGKGNPVTEGDIKRLPYLGAVVKETLRLHPSVPLLVPKSANSDIELCGFTVPKGSQVLVNVWAIGRDPDVWERPLCFEPERFLGSDIDVRGQHFELLPFGGGRRICLGLPLASRILHLILGSLIHTFDWKLEDGVEPGSIDMEEVLGVDPRKAKPLLAIPTSV